MKSPIYNYNAIGLRVIIAVSLLILNSCIAEADASARRSGDGSEEFSLLVAQACFVIGVIAIKAVYYWLGWEWSVEPTDFDSLIGREEGDPNSGIQTSASTPRPESPQRYVAPADSNSSHSDGLPNVANSNPSQEEGSSHEDSMPPSP